MIVPPFETVYITWPDYDYEYLELSVNESTHIHVKCLLWFSKLHNWWKELTFIMLNILLRGYKNNCQWSNERTWNVWNWHQLGGSFQSPPPSLQKLILEALFSHYFDWERFWAQKTKNAILAWPVTIQVLSTSEILKSDKIQSRC